MELTDTRYGRGLVSAGNANRLGTLLAASAGAPPLVYGAIGGSITAGASATPRENGYAHRFAAWLDRHCQSGCTLVNAGLGASNSLFGTYRAQQDLLSHQPDIITIEYAVNDITNPEVEASYESLVRQCLAQKNRPAVILIFTMKRDGRNDQSRHQAIGRHYNLPMLSYRDAIYPDIQSGQLRWEDVSPDDVHPNNDGHAFIADMLARLASQAQAGADPEAALPPALHPPCNKFLGGRVCDANHLDIISQKGWTTGPHKGGYTGLQSQMPGSEVTVRFKGKVAFIGWQQYAGDFGRAEAVLDGGAPVLLEGYYQRPPIQAWAGGHTVLVRLLDTADVHTHTLTIRLLDDTHPDSHGHKFDIGYLLIS